MKSIEYLRNKLSALFSDISGIKIRYEFKVSTNTHIIEILPIAFFDSNDEYIKRELQIEEDFENHFPQENILFISKDSLSEIHKPNYTWGYEDFEIDLNIVSNDSNFEFEGFSDKIIDNQENLAIAA